MTKTAKTANTATYPPWQPPLQSGSLKNEKRAFRDDSRLTTVK